MLLLLKLCGSVPAKGSKKNFGRNLLFEMIEQWIA
jgi:hypothetical protein